VIGTASAEYRCCTELAKLGYLNQRGKMFSHRRSGGDRLTNKNEGGPKAP
jgi:hypothetical protein